MNNKELAYLADLASVVADGVIICTHPRAISAFFDNLSEEPFLFYKEELI